MSKTQAPQPPLLYIYIYIYAIHINIYIGVILGLYDIYTSKSALETGESLNQHSLTRFDKKNFPSEPSFQ